MQKALVTKRLRRILESPGYRELFAETNEFPLRHAIHLACKYIPGFTLFRKWNILRDVAYGFIGDRGTGKSTTQADLAIHDHMMLEEPCWSNLKIRAKLKIDNHMDQALWEMEQITGIEIKTDPLPIYESLPLDPNLLLSPECPYQGGCIVVDEINIELADSWRTMSNDALASSDMMQTLRKLKSAFIFSCISEMFVPNRIRDAVDIYFKLQDYAFVNESQLYGQGQGHDFKLEMYPMTGKFAGYRNTFARLREPYLTLQVHGRDLWGIVDTWDRRERQKHTSSLYKQLVQDAVSEVQESDTMTEHDYEVAQSEIVRTTENEWGWLLNHPFIRKMYETGAQVRASELIANLASDVPKGVDKQSLLAHFELYCNPDKRFSAGQRIYSFGALDRREYLEREKNISLVPA